MKLAQFIVDHVVTVIVMVLVILVFGGLAYATLPREAAPDVKIPVVIVVTPYPGVSPVDVESLVTIPLERKLNEIKDVTKLSSSSSEGVSTISMEFDPDVNIDEALTKVREKVDSAGADIPEDVEDTMVMEISFSDFPILIVTLTGDMDEEALKVLGEDLEEKIEGISGVLDVKMSGGLTRQIKVQVNPDRMALYSLSFNDIMGGIRNENVNIPGGTVDAGAANFMLRVPGEFSDVSQIEDIPVKSVGGQTIFLRDVARVVDGFAERATYSRLDGNSSISLSVQKRVGENIVRIAKATGALVAEESKTWPEGTKFTLLSDQSRGVEDLVSELENNIISGLLLVVIVILFFMGLRNSLFVALAIPMSMLISFVVIQLMGLTLNFVVLFSLILALGMLVDNAIVIVENIYRHLEEGYDVKEASVRGVAEVAMPVATSTLTTVLAFAPLLFWGGIMGEFMGYLPLTLIIVLTSSLFVALVVIPAATSIFMKIKPEDVTGHDESGVIEGDGIGAEVMRLYQRTLGFSIDHRYISLTLGVLSMVATMGIYGAFNHGTEFFPETEPDTAVVTVEAPDGTRLEETDRIIRRIEGILDQLEDVDNYVTEVGVGGSQFATSSSPNAGRITVNFLPSADKAREWETPRSGSTFDAVDRLRTAAQTIPGATISVEKIQEGPPVGAPIAVEISGDDFYKLGSLAEDIQRELQTVPGVVDITHDYSAGRPELSFSVDRAAANKVGASTALIANTLRTAVAGTKASVLRDGDDEYDIVVELDPAFKVDLQSILSLRIPGRDSVSVPLSTVANYNTLGGAGALQRLDTERVVTISANIAEGSNQNEVRAKVGQLLEDYSLPEGYSVGLGGADEEQQKAATFLAKAFLAAIAMIFLVLVTQFNSATIPFIIMASVILSLIGVLWGLLITGTPFGIIMTGIGVISLAGVVVNNAIVLLDYINQLLQEGLEVKEALIRAGTVRFRPVVLTAITTVLGLVPMATGVSIDFANLRIVVGGSSSAFWGPMAVAVIFGLGVATVLTLILVPVMYSINDDIAGLIARIRGKGPKQTKDPEVTPEGGVSPLSQPINVILPVILALGFASPGVAQALTLEEAFQAAESNNIDLKILQEQTFQTSTYVGQGIGSLGPRVSAQANYNVNQYEIILPDFTGGDEDIVIQQKSVFDFSVSAVQPIINAQAPAALRGAIQLRESAEANEVYMRRQIRAATARSYYGLVVARQTLALRHQTLENAREQYDLAKAQVEFGAAAPMAALQGELGVSRAERELLHAERELEEAQEAFLTLTGVAPSETMELPAAFPIEVKDVDSAVDGALTQRSDLQAARAQAAAQRYNARAIYASWMPTVNGTFVYRWTQNSGFAGENGQWVAGLQASWTPWDGGLRVAQQRRGASEQRVAELNAQKAARQVVEDVKTTWERYQRAERMLEAVRAEVTLAEENMTLTESSFEAGAVNYIEVQAAQLALETASLGLLLETMNRDLVMVDLAVAMGLYE